MEGIHTQAQYDLEELQGLQPYEKFLKFGPESLTAAELLAIIIRTGTKNHDAMAIGREILELSGGAGKGLNSLYRLSLKDLLSLKGIGEVKAVKLKCIAELSRRMAKEQAKEKLQFLHPSTVAQYYMELRHDSREKVLLLLLDCRACLIEECTLSIGTVNASLVSPREIFLQALRAEAVNLMLLHNHPSGDPTPSRQDIAITRRVREIGDTIDIPLIDHVIIGDNKYLSFREQGLL